MKNQFAGEGVSIIFASPVSGQREHKFEDGKRLANFVWANQPRIFAEVHKNEQRD